MFSADCSDDEQPLNVARFVRPCAARATASWPPVSVATCDSASARISETSLSALTAWKRLEASTVYVLWPVLVKSYADETVDEHQRPLTVCSIRYAYDHG